jgi:peptide-methionine (R)-S-oxide reductase
MTRERRPHDLPRRHFLQRMACALGGSIVASSAAWRGQSIEARSAAADVLIAQFSDAGVRQDTVRVPRIEKSDDEWQRQLSPLAFEVTRRGGTERPFSGAYWNLHDKGMFRCVCCDTALFSSAAKFDSGTGWPSFWQPIAKENVVTHPSRSLGHVESEVTCRRCDAHLGDVFDDGPRPTGLRYCIDSVALRFVKSV